MEEKDLFDQKILDHDPAPGSKKHVAGILDTIFSVGLLYLLGNYVLPSGLWNRLTTDYLIPTVFGFALVYRFLFIFFLALTPGMVLLRIEYLNGVYEKPNRVERLWAAFFIHYNGVAIYERRHSD